MKNIFIIIISVIFLFGCNKEAKKTPTKTSIVGKWQLTADWFGSVYDYSIKWKIVPNGGILKFHEDSNVETDDQTICQNGRENFGSYALSKNEEEKNIITIELPTCRQEEYIRTYSYSFEKGDLILFPLDETCDEGCGFRYSQVK